MEEHIVLAFHGRFNLATYTHRPSGEEIYQSRGMSHSVWANLVREFMQSHPDVPVVDNEGAVIGNSSKWFSHKG